MSGSGNAPREAAVAELKALLGERLQVSEDVRRHHAGSDGLHRAALPDAVAFAHSNGDVQRIVEICVRHGVPIIPCGAASSVEGQLSAVNGGISLDLTGMNHVVSIDAEDLTATVQCGVTREQLNVELRDKGLFFPIDPGANATLGGMAATRASGTNAVRYGTMRENVLALTAVMADGTIVRAGTRARKSSAGYDLTRLFVGSEGTLGIITELTVRLYGIPEVIRSAVCGFETLANAVSTVIQTIQLGVPIARIELLNAPQIDAINRYSGLDLEVRPTLFMEFHGGPASVSEQVETVEAIVAAQGGADFAWSADADERNRLWRARHAVFSANRAMCPGKTVWPSDVCVPISRLAECILETERDISAHNLFAPIAGHVGDGNFHVALALDHADPDNLATAAAVYDRMVGRVLEMGGTCTGEHGIGVGKVKYMEAEHGAGVAVMRAIKAALDPHGILNPGKILPATAP